MTDAELLSRADSITGELGVAQRIQSRVVGGQNWGQR